MSRFGHHVTPEVEEPRETLCTRGEHRRSGPSGQDVACVCHPSHNAGAATGDQGVPQWLWPLHDPGL